LSTAQKTQESGDNMDFNFFSTPNYKETMMFNKSNNTTASYTVGNVLTEHGEATQLTVFAGSANISVTLYPEHVHRMIALLEASLPIVEDANVRSN